MATEDEPPVESYELEGGGRIAAAETDWVGQTYGQEGVRGAYQVNFQNMENLESRRLIADVPSRDAAQNLVTGVGRAEERHRERSARARTVDEQKKAPMTTDFETWASNPRRWDYPGVDDPRTQGPEASGLERFRHQVEKNPDSIATNTPGPDVVDYRDLVDQHAFETGGDSESAARTTNADIMAAPGLGELERHHVSDWGTDKLFSMRERKMEGHSKARAGQKARGVRPGKTDYSDDDLMRDYLADVRAIDKELMARGEIG